MQPLIVLGACAGAGTITSALRAIQDEARSSIPALGYTVPYAVGNILLTAWGPVLVAMMAVYREKGAGAALAAFALETGLAQRFGFEWAYRPASRGRVIAGFPEKVIAQFSSRRAQITKATLALAEDYEKVRGHAPDQRALASMRQFANARTRRAKEGGALDFAALLRDWEHTSRDAELGALRDLARTIWRAAPGAIARPRARADTRAQLVRNRRPASSRGELTHAQQRAAMAGGLAQAQEARAAWTRADLVHCIAQNLPDHAIGHGQAHAWQLLDELTARALTGQAGEQVCRLDAPSRRATR